jgi:hypothetical protein
MVSERTDNHGYGGRKMNTCWRRITDEGRADEDAYLDRVCHSALDYVAVRRIVPVLFGIVLAAAILLDWPAVPLAFALVVWFGAMVYFRITTLNLLLGGGVRFSRRRLLLGSVVLEMWPLLGIYLLLGPRMPPRVRRRYVDGLLATTWAYATAAVIGMALFMLISWMSVALAPWVVWTACALFIPLDLHGLKVMRKVIRSARGWCVLLPARPSIKPTRVRSRCMMNTHGEHDPVTLTRVRAR